MQCHGSMLTGFLDENIKFKTTSVNSCEYIGKYDLNPKSTYPISTLHTQFFLHNYFNFWENILIPHLCV